MLKKLMFRYSEVIPLFFLLSCRQVLPSTFFTYYLTFLAIIFLIKLHICNNQYLPEPILATALMLTETSMIFIRYSFEAMDSVYKFLLLSMMLIMLISISYISKYVGNRVSSISDIQLYIISIILTIGGGISISFTSRRHDGIEIFKDLNIFLFMITLLHISKGKQRRTRNTIISILGFMLVLFLPVSPLIIMLFFCKELGTIMVMILTDLIALLIYSIVKHEWKLLLIAILIIICLITGWIILYCSPAKQMILKTALQNITGHDFSQQLNRIFIRYAKTDQIQLTNDICFSLLYDESKSKVDILIDMITRFFTAPNYREIVSHETNAFSSSADYAFSVMSYTTPFFSFFIVTISIVTLVVATIKSVIKKHVTFVIPLTLLITSFVHICGNLLVFPFTGIPLPFISYAKSSLVCTVFVVLFYAYAEMYETNYSDNIKF